jgi:MinD-like ATPase involved in chromosome partitioning or flagellar assembly
VRAPIVCWSVKGGSGTTVIASVIALLAARSASTLLVDLAGDCATALGVPDPGGPGITEWLQSAGAGCDSLNRLAVPVTDQLRLVSCGQHPPPIDARWAQLADALATLDSVVVDAGTRVPADELLAVAGASLLVIRPCFLALRRAAQLAVAPTAVVLIDEQGRSLSAREIERALGVPVIAEVPLDPAVFRAVDAGLLASRLPRSLVQQLRSAA